jgi:hypothetical protein
MMITTGGEYQNDRSGLFPLAGGSGSGAAANMTASQRLRLFESMKDINEVQYAQNFRMMILVHKRYAPLVMELQDGGINVNTFIPGYSVVVEKHDDLVKTAPVEPDKTYEEKGYLMREGEYPGAVTFFDGRLVFAATERSRQRIFASRVNDITRFSTYTLFLTRQRNYIVIKGTIDLENKKKIIMDTGEGLKFSEAITNYRVESVLFPYEDDVKVLELRSNYIEVSKPAVLLSDSYEDALAVIKENWTTYNGIPIPFSPFQISTDPDIRVYSAYCNIYVDRVEMGIDVGGIKPRMTFRLASNAAQTETQPSLMAFLVYNTQVFANVVAQIVPGFRRFHVTVTDFQMAVYCQWWYGRIMSSMMLSIENDTIKFYDLPANIEVRIRQMQQDWTNAYIPLYTEHIIEDRYPTPDDGFTFEIASDMSDGIKWLAQNKNLLVGTETGEWVIPSGTNATNIQAILNSRYGSDFIQATAVGDAMCFFQTGKKALVEYYIPQQDNNFRANNMAMLSKNMLHESPAFDFDFISAPYTKIFVSREDGIMAALLYERSTGTFAWGRITTGKEITGPDGAKTRTALIASVATIPGQSGYDDVYVMVRRYGDHFLEMLAERRRDDHEEAEVFLDSYRRWDGDGTDYADDAVVYDETDNRVYPLTKEPVAEHVMWVGYPYESRVRSMPVLANDRMKQNVIKNLYVRFNDSFMPRARCVSFQDGRERPGQSDSIPRAEPYSGVVQLPFPGVWGQDVFFEFVHDRPTRCRILAVNAEVN